MIPSLDDLDRNHPLVYGQCGTFVVPRNASLGPLVLSKLSFSGKYFFPFLLFQLIEVYFGKNFMTLPPALENYTCTFPTFQYNKMSIFSFNLN